MSAQDEPQCAQDGCTNAGQIFGGNKHPFCSIICAGIGVMDEEMRAAYKQVFGAEYVPPVSAQEELPPGWDDSDFDVGKRRDAQLLVAWTHWERESGITREEYTTMRAAAERCAELETALARVTVELDEARRMAEIRLHAIESIRHASLRATPTEGETE